MQENSGKPFNEDGINFRWFFSTFLGIWPWFLICIIVSLSFALLYLRYTTPIYKSSAEISIDDSKQKGGDKILQSLGIDNGKANIEGEIRILKSRTLMAQVVKDLKLNVKYYFKGRVKESELYTSKPFEFNLLSKSLDSISAESSFILRYIDNHTFLLNDNGKQLKGRFGSIFNTSLGEVVIHNSTVQIDKEAEYMVLISPILKATGAAMRTLEILMPSKSAGTVNISVNDIIPERGKDIVNTLIKLYIENNINDRNRMSNNTIQFIDERLVNVSKELTGIESDIEVFKKTNELTDVKEQSQLLLTTTSDNEQTYREKSIELAMIESLEKNVRNGNVIPGSIILADVGVRGYLDVYNNLYRQRQQLSMNYTEDNPVIRNLNLQIEDAKKDLIISITSLRNNIKSELNAVESQKNSIGAQIRAVPAKERIYLEYSRQQTLKQELYLFLLQKREETAITKSSTVAIAKVIDSAITNPNPVAPKRASIMYMAFLIGLLVPAVGLYLRRAMNNKIISKLDITKQTDVPILGEIGHYDETHAIAVKNNSNTVLSEQFRALRTNLQFILSDKKDKVILLTSSMSGEGKSFIAINLASTFALSGKKVVLMELDLRKPKISQNLGLDNGIGFSTYAIDKASIDQIIKPSGILDNFYVISSGPIPPNPAELIMLPRIEELFAELRERFDYVVIDTAPLGLVTDAQLLGKFADASLYVVRQAYTLKQQIQIPHEVSVSDKLKRISIIVNDVKFNRGFLYGYGYGYGQNYGYGYGGYGYGYGYGGYGYGTYGNGYFTQGKKLSFFKRIMRRIKGG